MEAFVTGASGFVGSHVARLLVERGARVRCLVRPTSRADALRSLGADLVFGDVRELPAVRRAMRGADVVFHCAADYRLDVRDRDALYDTNVAGTNNVMCAAFELGTPRVVHTSSVATLAASADGTPADETARAGLAELVGPYKRSKWLAERVVEGWVERGLPAIIVNPSTPVGEGDGKPTPTGRIIVDFLNGRMPAYVDTGLNVVDVRDVAAGHLLAAERGRMGERYILGNVNLTLLELLELVGRTAGRRAPRLRLPVWLPLALARIEAPWARVTGRAPRVSLEGARMAKRKMYFDPRKAVRELGLPANEVEAAVARAVKWFVDHRVVHGFGDARAEAAS